MRDDCIFCKLANGIIPATTLYEDEDFTAIFDAGPASKGHALILPKEHCANIYEMSEDTASKIFVLAKKLATELTEESGCAGMNILQNNGEAAGQTVFHLHMHLIPRYENDGVGISWKQGEADGEYLKGLAERIKKGRKL